jgi:nicotinamide-nucleotide adenylyltransferase
MRSGLYIGRFQPFHNGHLTVIMGALSEVDHLYIGIGSSNVLDGKNPFTFGQRKMMIEAALDGIVCHSRFTVVAIPDFNDNEKWMAFIAETLPRPDVVFSGNQVVIDLFRVSGVPVRVLNVRYGGLSGTEIRRRMRSGVEWQSMVPAGVIGVITK